MSQSSRIISVSTSTEGLPAYERQEHGTSHLEACGKRWASQQKALKDAPWAACPPELSADFVRSMARELLQNDGDNAASRACLLMGSLMAENNLPSISLSLRCPALNSGIEIEGRIGQATSPSSDAVVFELAVDEDASERDVRDALAAIGSQSKESQFFDPISQTPDIQLAQLLARAEQIVGNSSLDPLVLAAGTLLVWNKMEATNSATFRLELSGLSDGEDMLIGEGESVVFNGKRKALEFASDMHGEVALPNARATVRMPKR